MSVGERWCKMWTLTGLPVPKVVLRISLWLEERVQDPFAFWPRTSVDIEPIWGERKRERASEAPLAPSGSIDCCLFLFVYLFTVTAVKREAAGGMNAASPPGRELEGDSVCFIFKLCHANAALALIIALLCLCFTAFLHSGFGI